MRKTIRIIALIVFIASIAGLAYFMVENYIDKRHQAEIDALRGMNTDIPDLLDEYAALYQENYDTIGWLKIEGTNIDNVVMYAPHIQEKYLRTDFYGNHSTRGCLYIAENCDIFKSDNIIIYGHNMSDGSMFGTLNYYADEDFYQTHKTFSFDTIYEKQTYEVVAAIKTEIPPEGEECFRYYEYTGKNDADMFRQYVDFINENKLYSTGVELQEGDSILTLSTCAYHTEQGRFIVVARKIS
ncbi:MAG: class B sortase [Bacillota bacterium]|nr:class B sortase [Bacillota bacterium]